MTTKREALIRICLQIRGMNSIIKTTQERRDKLIASALKENKIDFAAFEQEYNSFEMSQRERHRTP